MLEDAAALVGFGSLEVAASLFADNLLSYGSCMSPATLRDVAPSTVSSGGLAWPVAKLWVRGQPGPLTV